MQLFPQLAKPGIPKTAPTNKEQEVAKWKAKILKGTTAEFLLRKVDINCGQKDNVMVEAPKKAKTHANISQWPLPPFVWKIKKIVGFKLIENNYQKNN